LAIFYRSIYVQ